MIAVTGYSNFNKKIIKAYVFLRYVPILFNGILSLKYSSQNYQGNSKLIMFQDSKGIIKKSMKVVINSLFKVKSR